MRRKRLLDNALWCLLISLMPVESTRQSSDIGPNSLPSGRGQVTVTRTYLAMTRPDQLRCGDPPALPTQLIALDPCTIDAWRMLYTHIGSQWHWHDRDAWSDADLQARLDTGRVSVFRVRAELPHGVIDDAGFLELEHHPDGSIELAYVGLDSRVFGHGIGRWLVAEATALAWSRGATHVWLHTCTLDSESALPNYLARGFQPTRQEQYVTEIANR
ncbi:MAG: GNAT family N-acetyltransferase [Gemmatimonadaceae bacterium]|nr:GNAT family N-acetyltransferase [Gemmatimonadaceae bacterium]